MLLAPASAGLHPAYRCRIVAALRRLLVQRPGDPDICLHRPGVELLAVVLAQRLGVDAQIQSDLIVADAIAGQRLHLRRCLWRRLVWCPSHYVASLNGSPVDSSTACFPVNSCHRLMMT